MPALTHNRVKNGFNGGRRLLNANAGIKFGRTIGATTADASRSDALVGGIGPRSKFVRRAINNRAITSKQGGCCHNMDKEFPKAILYYSSPGPYKNNNSVNLTITAVFDKRMDSNFNVKIAISGVSTSISATNMTRVNSTTYTYLFTNNSFDNNGTNTIVLSNGKDIVGNILNDVAKNNTFIVDNKAPTLAQVTAVSTPGNNQTPSYVFSSDEAGTITSGLGFSSTTSAINGNNTITFNTLVAGTYTPTITVTDAAGNASTALTAASFVIDLTAPTLSNISIASDNATTTTLAKENDNVTLTFTASDTIQTPVVTFTSNGVSITDTVTYTNTTGNTWTAVYTTDSSDTDGIVAYSIAFSDSAGNAGTAVTSGTGSVTTDNAAPTNQNTVFTTATSIKGGGTVTIASSLDANNTVWLALTGTATFAVNAATMTKASGTATSITAPTTAGTYYIYVVDQAGNASSQSNAALTVDTTAPSISTALAVNMANTSATITFSEEVFQSNGSTRLTANELSLTIASGTGTATLASYTVSTMDDTTFTFALTLSGTPDRTEVLTLTATVYDGATNSASVSDTVTLN